MSFGRYRDGAIGDCAGMRGMSPRFYSSAFRALSGLRWCAGHNPVFLLRQCGARTPSFPFLEKEKRGEKRKSLNQQTRRKRTRRIKAFYPPKCALAPKGAVVRNSAYLPRSVSFPRATSALTRVVYLSDHPSCTIRWGLPVLGRRALSIGLG